MPRNMQAYNAGKRARLMNCFGTMKDVFTIAIPRSQWVRHYNLQSLDDIDAGWLDAHYDLAAEMS